MWATIYHIFSVAYELMKTYSFIIVGKIDAQKGFGFVGSMLGVWWKSTPIGLGLFDPNLISLYQTRVSDANYERNCYEENKW